MSRLWVFNHVAIQFSIYLPEIFLNFSLAFEIRLLIRFQHRNFFAVLNDFGGVDLLHLIDLA